MRPARFDNVVLDSVHPEGLVSFWCAILGAEVLHRTDDGVFIEIGAAAHGGPSLILQRVPEPKTVKNRMHVDLEVDDLDKASTGIEALGGTWTDGRTYGDATNPWRIMADPEGNEFCIFPMDRTTREA